MKIYFAGSIRGGREDQTLYQEIIKFLSTFGVVLTEHFGEHTIKTTTGTGSNVMAIYKQDMAWIKEADVIVAEVTQPSLGVGYEIAKAEEMNKRILCLYRPSTERSLSAMLSGNKKLVIKEYTTVEEVDQILKDFFR